jgi:hypothetical protein
MLWPDHATHDEDANLVQVYTTAGLYQAEIIRGKLETNGIPVLLKYESLGPVMGLTVDGLGEVQVWVPASRAAVARDLLNEPAPIPDADDYDDELMDANADGDD